MHFRLMSKPEPFPTRYEPEAGFAMPMRGKSPEWNRGRPFGSRGFWPVTFAAGRRAIGRLVRLRADGSHALPLAGLGLIGAITRRRKA